MANIVKLMNLLDDNEIRMQIALFDGVNMSSVAKEAGNRILSGLADVANAFSETFTSKQVINYKYKTSSDEVMDRYVELSKISRKELMEDMYKKLLQAYKEINGKEYEGDVESPIFTKALVDIAAYGFNINLYKPVGSKIDEIAANYEKLLINAFYSHLQNLSEDDLKETIKLLDRALARLSLENKRKLQEAIMPTAFNAKGIILALRKRKDVEKLKLSLELLGEDAFKFLDVDLSVVFQTIRGLGRVSRILIARLIFKLSRSSGRKFSYGNEKLPSGASDTILEEEKEKDRLFRESLKGEITVQKRIDELEKKRDSLEATALKLDEEIKEVMEGFYEAKEEFDLLDAKKADYLEKKRPQPETKVYYNKVNETKRKMDRSSDIAEKKSNKLLQIKEQLEENKKSIELEKETLSELKKKSFSELSLRADELMGKWSKRFNKLKFDPSIFQNLIIRFSFEERLEIERMLLEIEQEDNYYDLSLEEREIKVYISIREYATIKIENFLCKDII